MLHLVCTMLLAPALTIGAGGAKAGLSHSRFADPKSPIELSISYTFESGDARVSAHVEHAVGSSFRMFVSQLGQNGSPDPATTQLVGQAPLNGAGQGSLIFSLPGAQSAPMGFPLAFTAVDTISGASLGSTTAFLGLNPPCDTIDWDFQPAPVAVPGPVSGTVMSSQYSAIGLMVSAQNNVAGHPDMALAFDSANIQPCSNDPDLTTPGYGPNNTIAYGTLLILAENATDADMDGVIDCPDDESGGGTLYFDFSPPARLCSITLVDIDDASPTSLRFYDGSTLLATIPAPNMGDNSVQTLNFDVSPVSQLRVVLGGSGGVAEIGAALCPTRVDFNQSTTGVPRGFSAGLVVSNQIMQLGLTCTAQNNNVAHPDTAILFDTAAPTGGDTDLATPGYGPNNNNPTAPSRGLALIIAENDVDADFDGLIDVPDDEELGGILSMSFPEDVVFLSATLLDIDVNEISFLEFFDAANTSLGTLPLAPLGDNSLQEATGLVEHVRRVELRLGEGSATGSGAWIGLEYCPQVLQNAIAP